MGSKKLEKREANQREEQKAKEQEKNPCLAKNTLLVFWMLMDALLSVGKKAKENLGNTDPYWYYIGHKKPAKIRYFL